MTDENVNSKPYKVGDKLILEIEITDEDKSFDFIGKALCNKIDTSTMGFNINLVSFWKDRYIDNIPIELRSEVKNILLQTIDNINELLELKQ